LLLQADTQRKTILETLAEAEKYYTTAGTQSKAFGTWIADRYQGDPLAAKPWQEVAENVHAGRFQVQLGIVQRHVGTLHMAEAALLSEVESTRAFVQTTLGGASLQPPDSMKPIERSTLSELLKSSAGSLEESKSSLENATTGNAPKAIKDNSRINLLITLHAQIQLSGLMQALGEPGAPNVTQVMEAAVPLKDEIVNEKLRLPRLPGELGQLPMPASPTAPSTPGTPATPAAPATPAVPASPEAAPAIPEGGQAAPNQTFPEMTPKPAAPDAPATTLD
jgi:hypothetical protein